MRILLGAWRQAPARRSAWWEERKSGRLLVSRMPGGAHRRRPDGAKGVAKSVASGRNGRPRGRAPRRGGASRGPPMPELIGAAGSARRG